MKEMDFWEHLDELRTRLIRCLIYIGLGATGVWYYYPFIFNLLTQPIKSFLDEMKGRFVVIGITEPFVIKMEFSLIVGAVVVAPLILYEIWGFFSPAFSAIEKRWAKLIIFPSVILFFTGAVFGYFVIPPGFKFLLQQSPPDVTPFLSINNYLMLLAKMFIAFGLVFQLPLIALLLAEIGLINTGMLVARWREIIVGIFVIGAIITPSVDVITLLIVSLPIVFLYVLSVFLTFLVERRKRKVVKTSN
ncbi:twin-arginine translocase subunit TatC [bacterium]|nr:twin-arginine translocase subunit TatC [bacterium]